LWMISCGCIQVRFKNLVKVFVKHQLHLNRRSDIYSLLGCKDDDGKMHRFNSEWDQECMRCMCRETLGIICCNMTLRPMLYDKEKCTEIFKPDKCSYIAVERKNPSELCQVG
uniref:Beta-microseminoprotein n=1 Tax=Sarcophilus harrisii TaxID=9305 RepID=A0A7N4V2G9_SARHA